MGKIFVFKKNTLGKSQRNPYDLNSYANSVMSSGVKVIYTAKGVHISGKYSRNGKQLNLSSTLVK